MSGRQLLVTDLDGTLLGDDDALSRFRQWRAGGGSEVVLAFATGRTCADVARLVAAGMTPAPDYTIGALGTELWEYASNCLATIGPRLGRSRWDAQWVRRVVVKRSPEARLQPNEYQSPYKASFFIESATPARLTAICEALARARLDFEMIYSGNRFLDILPQGVGKGSTTRVLAERLGISPQNVVVCGDSGNDVSLFSHGFRGVLVANADQDLRDAAPEDAYRSVLAHADGVLDGIVYWMERGNRHTRTGDLPSQAAKAHS
jgi:sucrose-6F-phosphate phosphohydrolase